MRTLSPMMRSMWILTWLVAAAFAPSEQLRAQDEDAELAELLGDAYDDGSSDSDSDFDGSDGEAEQADDEAEQGPGFFADVYDSLREDPTLGGNLRLTYRSTYVGRLYDFDAFEFPFGSAVTAQDQLHAAQLSALHGDDQDHDFSQYFSAGWKDIYEGDSDSLVQTVSANLSFKHYQDLDGSPGGEASLNQYDRFRNNSDFRLYTANATIEAFARHLRLTVGRQRAHEAEWVHFDGVGANFRGVTFFDRPVEFDAFGGSRVKFFRSVAAGRDAVFGGGVKMWPARSWRMSLSAVHHHSTTFEARVKRQFDGAGWLAATYRQVDENPASFKLDGSYAWRDQDVTLYLNTVHRIAGAQDDFDFGFTRVRRGGADAPVYFNLGDLAGYDEVTGELRKGFLEYYGVSLGGTAHFLRDRDLEDSYNTDWREAWLAFDVSHAPWHGFTGRVSLRYLETAQPRRLLRVDPTFAITNGSPDFRPEDLTGDGEPSYVGVDFWVEQDFNRYAAIGAVLDFRSYDYQSNYVSLEDIDLVDISTYVRWRPTARTEWSLRYSYTRDFEFLYPDLEALHTVRAEFIFRL